MSNLISKLKKLIQKHPWMSTALSLYAGTVSEREGLVWALVKVFLLGIIPA